MPGFPPKKTSFHRKTSPKKRREERASASTQKTASQKEKNGHKDSPKNFPPKKKQHLFFEQKKTSSKKRRLEDRNDETETTSLRRSTPRPSDPSLSWLLLGILYLASASFGTTNHETTTISPPLLIDTPWKIKGWNLQPSPVFRKENDLNQTSMIMFHVNLPGRNILSLTPRIFLHSLLFFGRKING